MGYQPEQAVKKKLVPKGSIHGAAQLKSGVMAVVPEVAVPTVALTTAVLILAPAAPLSLLIPVRAPVMGVAGM
jgi:hypothetical protein